MTTFINKIVDAYNYVFTDLADPRTNNYFLISSPIPICMLTVLYLYFCLSFGPKFMRDREPYKLKNVLLVYNAFQVAMNTYLFSQGVWYKLSDEFTFNCEVINYSSTPRALWVAVSGWLYFMIKVLDFLDTIFFVLRKKNNQISFLHVYHHSLMAVCAWFVVKYYAGGQPAVLFTLNSFVHVVMYAYYFIAGLGPEYQKYIWWKKHVTILQLGQFVLVLIHALNGLFNGCKYPKAISVVIIANSLIFINLFGQFFYISYIKKKDDINGTAKYRTATNGTTTNGTTTNGTTINGTTTNVTVTTNTLTNKTNRQIHIQHADIIKNGVENINLNGKHKED